MLTKDQFSSSAWCAVLWEVVAELPRPHVAHEVVVTPWEQKGTVMRTLVERSQGRDLVLVDGVKVIEDDGWALVLPDPEEPLTHVWAEAASDSAAEARARSRFRVTDEEIASSVSAFLGPILERGEYPRLREALTSDNRLDPKQEMQVSIELILDGAAARIAAT